MHLNGMDAAAAFSHKCTSSNDARCRAGVIHCGCVMVHPLHSHWLPDGEHGGVHTWQPGKGLSPVGLRLLCLGARWMFVVWLRCASWPALAAWYAWLAGSVRGSCAGGCHSDCLLHTLGQLGHQAAGDEA